MTKSPNSWQPSPAKLIPDEMTAIRGLLQLDDKRTIHDSWQTLHYPPPIATKAKINGLSYNHNRSLTNKISEKERLKQLEQQDQVEVVQIEQQLTQKQIRPPNINFMKHTKLRGVNSNITFYEVSKKQKEVMRNSSISFYQKSNKKFYDMKIEKDRYFEQQCPQNLEKRNFAVVYFKPNKSESIRQLLNQMKTERQKSTNLILNSTSRRQQQNSHNQIRYVNQTEFKQIIKYRKFVPFQQDQTLLLSKIAHNENIWLKKFRQGWHRRKNQMEGRRSVFKPLRFKD